MVDKIRQPISSEGTDDEKLAQLFKQGDTVKPRMDKAGEWLAEKMGIKYVSAPLKGEKRAKEKVSADYEGDFSRLTDITRCSFVCDNYEQMQEVSDRLKKALEVKQEKNTVEAPKSDGLGHRNMNQLTDFTGDITEDQMGFREMELSADIQGHVSEIQIQLKCMYEAANKEGHSIYEEHRTLKSDMDKLTESGEMPPKADRRKLSSLEEESITLYDNELVKYNEETTGQKIKLHREVYGDNRINSTPKVKQEVSNKEQPKKKPITPSSSNLGMKM